MGTHPIFESDFDCLTEKKMYELSEVGIVEFLRDKGGRCPNTELSNQFKSQLVDSTSKKAFSAFVNKVAFVKTKDENGQPKKFVYLKKDFRQGMTQSNSSTTISSTNNSPKLTKKRTEPSAPPERSSPLTLPTEIKIKTPPERHSPPTHGYKTGDRDQREHRLRAPPPTERIPERESPKPARKMRASSPPRPKTEPEKFQFKKPPTTDNKPPVKAPLAESNNGNNNGNKDKNMSKSDRTTSQESIRSLGTDSVTNRNHLGAFEKEWFCSAMDGNIQDVKAKLKTKPDLLEHKDYILGYTASHWAVKTNNVDLLKLLIHCGIDMDSRSHSGGTLLHLAVQSAHYDIIKLLTTRVNAKLKVDIGARDNLGKLPRHYLQRDRFSDEEYDYLVRNIVPPRLAKPRSSSPEPSSFDQRRPSNSSLKDKSGMTGIFSSMRYKGSDILGLSKTKSTNRKNTNFKSNNPSRRGWNNE